MDTEGDGLGEAVSAGQEPGKVRQPSGSARPAAQVRGVLAERVMVSTALDPFLSLKALAGCAGLSVRIRFHDLRHTFASRLLQNGESPGYVKEQMGHHSIKVTVDIYGHLVPGSNREAVDRLDVTGRNPRATSGADQIEGRAVGI